MLLMLCSLTGKSIFDNCSTQITLFTHIYSEVLKVTELFFDQNKPHVKQ
jgi:hypothetical protein